MKEERKIPKICEDLRRVINGRVLALMEERDWDRAMMAAKLGVSTETLSRRLRREAPWTSDEIAALAKVSQKSADEILRRF